MKIVQTYSLEYIEKDTEEFQEYLNGLKKGYDTGIKLYKDRRISMFNPFEAFDEDYPRGGLSFGFFYGYIDGYSQLRKLWNILR